MIELSAFVCVNIWLFCHSLLSKVTRYHWLLPVVSISVLGTSFYTAPWVNHSTYHTIPVYSSSEKELTINVQFLCQETITVSKDFDNNPISAILYSGYITRETHIVSMSYCESANEPINAVP